MTCAPHHFVRRMERFVSTSTIAIHSVIMTESSQQTGFRIFDHPVSTTLPTAHDQDETTQHFIPFQKLREHNCVSE